MPNAQWLLAALLLGSPPALGAEAPKLRPAQQAYKDVSEIRDRVGEIVWDGKPADTATLERVLAELREGLRRVDDPLVQDLGEGNVYLRFRRVNYLIDVVKVAARLHHDEQAIAAWQALSRMSGGGNYFKDDPAVMRLWDDPRLAGVRARFAVETRLAAAPALATPYRETLPVAERIAGLSRLWSVARDGFAWFDHVPDLDWDQAYLETLPQVIAAERTEDYYRVLTRFVARLGDGHSGVYFPEPLQARVYSWPGLRTARIDGHVLVTRVADPALAARGVRAGDELLAIDGTAVADYVAKNVAPYVSSSTPQDREVREYAYELLAGPADRPLQLQLAHADGTHYTLSAPRSGFEETDGPAPVGWTLRADGVAVLKAGQFEDDAATKLLAEKLASGPAPRALVIDLRGNGGGSSYNGLAILEQVARASLPEVDARYRENTAFGAARSSGTEWRTLPPSGARRRNDGNVFAGPVAMLVDARTFSAAEDTAAVFKLMQRGPIVGMPSGGSTGQPLMLTLPGGGTARICVKRDSYPDGSDFVGVGVLPDVEAPRTVRDVRDGTDSTLERAASLLLRSAMASE